VLYLSGILQAPESAEPEFAVLPQGARPAHYLWLSYMNFGGDDLGEMEIEPNGGMFAYSTTAGGPPADPSLATISFPLSSDGGSVSAHSTGSARRTAQGRPGVP
jgi:hypothetical protein